MLWKGAGDPADVNVLVYAFRADSTDHAKYRHWLDELVNADAAYGMSLQVLAALIRVTTHPRILIQPSRLADAITFANVLLDQRYCRIVEPGPQHWSIFTELCRRTKATGNIVEDAWLAALAIESGCEWITTDRDFARFDELRWRAPF